MLQHVEAKKGEPIVVKKPEWIVHDATPSAPATPLDAKKTQMSEVLVHNAHTPSNGSFTPGPAPYKEDGASVWERDGTSKKKKLCYPDGASEAVYGDEKEEEEAHQKENDPRWNIKRRLPVKTREGEFEKDFRSRESYSGKRAEGEEEEEEQNEREEGQAVEKEEEKGSEERRSEEEQEITSEKKGEEKEDEQKGESAEKRSADERKVKIPKHLVSGPLW